MDNTTRDLFGQCDTDAERLAMANAILRTLLNHTFCVIGEGSSRQYIITGYAREGDPVQAARDWLLSELDRE